MPNDGLRAYAADIANQYGIPVDYFLRFIGAESSWNPSAISEDGAMGIVQIVPKWHPGVDVWNPEKSIAYAGKTISGYYQKQGDWASAFASWNAGAPTVNKYGGVPPFKETQDYIDKIIPGWRTNPALAKFGPDVANASGPGNNIAKIIIWIIGVLMLLVALYWIKFGSDARTRPVVVRAIDSAIGRN